MKDLDFLINDFERVSYLANLLTSRATGLSCDDEEYVQLRQALVQNPKIFPHLPSFVRQHRTLDSFWGFIQPKFKSYAERRSFISEQFTPLLDSLEFGNELPATQIASPPRSDPRSSGAPLDPISEISSLHVGSFNSIFGNMYNRTSNMNTSKPINTAPRNKRKVFIVHGRNNEVKQEVSRFISTLGLEPIILHEQASAGMTIIEKIERYSSDADFALVLYTACDQGRGEHERHLHPKFRARQNVVFEHGYLMAKLGRENVCALVKGEIETPNDINGVVYVSLDDGGAWKMAVAKELVVCGYQINSLI